MRYAIAVLTLPIFLAPVAARAEWALLGAARDNTLFESPDGSLSNGAGSYLFAGTTGSGAIRRGLLAFDLSEIPAGSVVESVELTLHMSRTPTASEPVSLHRMSADWGEGASVGFGEEGGGGVSEPGDATWIHRFYPGDPWASPGGDFDPLARATIFVFGQGFYTWGSTPMMVADVQGWLDQPDSNFGWLLLGNEELPFTAKRFDSRENPEPAFRPMLAVEYTPIPEPCSFVFCIVIVAACNIRPKRA